MNHCGCEQATPTYFNLDFTQDPGGFLEGTDMGTGGLSLTKELEMGEDQNHRVTFMSFQRGCFDAALGCCGSLYLVDRPKNRVLILDLERSVVSLWRSPSENPGRPGNISIFGFHMILTDARTNQIYCYDLRSNRLTAKRSLGQPFKGVVAAGPGGSIAMARDGESHVTVLDGKKRRRIIGGHWLAGYGIRHLQWDGNGRIYILADNRVQQKLLRFHRDGSHEGTTPVFCDFLHKVPGAEIHHALLRRDHGLFGLGWWKNKPRLFYLSKDQRELRQWAPPEGQIGLIFNPPGRLLFLRRQTIGGKKFNIVTTRPLRTNYGTGTWRSQALDSGGADTLWHKWVFDAVIPKQTQIQIYYRITNHGAASPSETREWIGPVSNQDDALFRAPPGRFLFLKIKLRGFHDHSPVLARLQVHFPRQSWMSYLPAVYGETMPPDRFPERFLAIFQTLYEGVERQIDDLPAWLDADVAPAEALPALASWLGLNTDDRLDTEILRQEIKRAPGSFRGRGTRHGLKVLLNHLTLGAAKATLLPRPLIVERFQVEGLRNQPFKPKLDRYFGKGSRDFCVFLDPEHLAKDLGRRIKSAIREWTPAHCRAMVVPLPKTMITGAHMYLGVNSYLAPRGKILGIDTVLRRTP